MLMNPVEFSAKLPNKICPECGEPIKEQVESNLHECDYCLSKKAE